ncbi:hypothetical protein PRIPAC_81683 [Pristionchus pacificus]|uniref:Uncharacterized protein n=1 Tax=Pristionchus pacificus TaxID=54126 RepID=A0A454XRD3_PRIPA|nr:hypothetical protein PRIPAC_81683 [Pristionchus pacificus]|eukprot:PDM69912.1 hypothetical protein PRIPAC_49124 [Pristionchus pacificus]
MQPIFVLCALLSVSQAALSLTKNELPIGDPDFLVVPRFHSNLFDALATAVAMSDRQHHLAEGFSDSSSQKPMKHYEERRHFNEITAEMPFRFARRGGAEEFMA